MPQTIRESFRKLQKLLHGEHAVRWIVMVGLAGLLCILLSALLPDDATDSVADAQTEAVQTETQTAAQLQAAEDYAASLEERLEAILTQIDGVGDCQVMLTVSGSASYSYAQDTEQEIREDQQEVQQEHVILEEKTGDAPLVESMTHPQVQGVIVVCSGGDDPVTQEQVYEAVRAVLALPSSRIYVTRGTT